MLIEFTEWLARPKDSGVFLVLKPLDMFHTLTALPAKNSQPYIFIQVRHYAKAASTKRVSSTMRREKKAKVVVGYNRSKGPKIMYRALPPDPSNGPLFQRATDIELPPFQPAQFSSLSVNTLMSFQNELILKAYGVPKTSVLEFRLLPKPCFLVRDVTVNSIDTIMKAGEGNSEQSRFVYSRKAGTAGCGKTFLLLQTVDYALSAGWVVLYIPRAISLLNSSTPFRYDLRTRTFHQPQFSQQLLRRLLSVNEKTLKSITINRPFENEKLNVFAEGMPIIRLIQAGIKDINFASDILAAVLDQLAGQTEHPVLLAVDDFQALYCTSEYKDPDFNLIQSYHLSVPRLILEYAGGLKSFSRGAVLGAISSTNTRYNVPVVLREALQMHEDRFITPYDHRSPELQLYSKGLKNFELPSRLTVLEAVALFEFWNKIFALHSRKTDNFFMSKYTEACGNARELVWSGFFGTLESA